MALPRDKLAAFGRDEVNLVRSPDRRHEEVKEPAKERLQRAKQDDGSPPRPLVAVLRVNDSDAAQIAAMRRDRHKREVKTRRESVSSDFRRAIRPRQDQRDDASHETLWQAPTGRQDDWHEQQDEHDDPEGQPHTQQNLVASTVFDRLRLARCRGFWLGTRFERASLAW